MRGRRLPNDDSRGSLDDVLLAATRAAAVAVSTAGAQQPKPTDNQAIVDALLLRVPVSG